MAEIRGVVPQSVGGVMAEPLIDRVMAVFTDEALERASIDVRQQNFGSDWRRQLRKLLMPIVNSLAHETAWQDIAIAPQGDEVLVADTAHQVWSAVQRNDATWESADGMRLYVRFTHWMPLPEPPTASLVPPKAIKA